MTGREARPQPELDDLAVTDGNPYVGPRPLRVGEPIFGRDRDVRALADLVLAERIVLLYSPSGAGKSSLLEAGLRPLLSEALDVLPTIRVATQEVSPTAANRYVRSAVQSLAAHHDLGSTPGMLGDGDVDPAGELDAWLHEHERVRGDSDVHTCLFLDQLEELFTLDPSDGPAKAYFMRALAEALRPRHRSAVLAMREEYAPQLDPFLPLFPQRLRARYRLDLLGVAGAVAAVNGPAARRNAAVEHDAAQLLVDSLRGVRMMQGGVIHTVPGPYVEPVQLQVVCRQLWASLEGRSQGRPVSTIRRADVEHLGDVDDALGDYYDNEIARASAQSGVGEGPLRRWLERSLLMGGFRAQVASGPAHEGGEAVMRLLVESHLLRTELRRGTVWYELAHDRLIAPALARNAAWRERHGAPFQLAARRWQTAERRSDILLRPTEIEAAERALQDSPDDFDAVDRAFVEASRSAFQERQQRSRHRRTWLLAIAAVAGIVIAGSFGLLANKASHERDRAMTALEALQSVVDRNTRTTPPTVTVTVTSIGPDPTPVTFASTTTGMATTVPPTKSPPTSTTVVPSTDTTTSALPPPTSQPPRTLELIVKATTLNLRVSPGTSSLSLAIVGQGTLLLVDCQAPDSDGDLWFRLISPLPGAFVGAGQKTDVYTTRPSVAILPAC